MNTLIMQAIDTIVIDMENGDLTALELLLGAVPVELLEAYISEVDCDGV